MGEIDATAPEPTEVLIERAGAAVARCALRMMGGGYGRRVVVVAGKGNNGADGLAAAARLRRRGAAVRVIPAAEVEPVLPRSDLVIDAAYGPSPTPLTVDARRQGLAVIDGFDLLVEQAMLQYGHMTGASPSRDTMLRAGYRWIRRRRHGEA